MLRSVHACAVRGAGLGWHSGEDASACGNPQRISAAPALFAANNLGLDKAISSSPRLTAYRTLFPRTRETTFRESEVVDLWNPHPSALNASPQRLTTLKRSFFGALEQSGSVAITVIA